VADFLARVVDERKIVDLVDAYSRSNMKRSAMQKVRMETLRMRPRVRQNQRVRNTVIAW